MFPSQARRLLCKVLNNNQTIWYPEQWWKEEKETLQMMYNNNCSAAQRERVIGPALSPLQDEFITNSSKKVNSDIILL